MLVCRQIKRLCSYGLIIFITFIVLINHSKSSDQGIDIQRCFELKLRHALMNVAPEVVYERVLNINHGPIIRIEAPGAYNGIINASNNDFFGTIYIFFSKLIRKDIKIKNYELEEIIKSKSEDKRAFIWPWQNAITYEVTRVDHDKKYFELTSIKGKKYFLKRHESADKNSILRFVDQDETPFINEGYLEDIDYSPQLFSYENENLTILAQKNARSQSLASGSAKKDDVGLLSANLLMLDLLKRKKVLTIDDIEKLNLMIRQSFPIYQEDGVFKGIMRGRKKEITADNKTIVIDSTGVQATMGNIISFVSAREVIPKTQECLTRINKINNETSLNEILEITRDFILIHPFTNGNGRTARLLLDYMLLKRGFHPVPHEMGLTDSFLFKSIEEIKRDYLKAYEKTGQKIETALP